MHLRCGEIKMTQAQHNANNDETLDMLAGDETLDDLADLPKTAPFPGGAYVVDVFPKRNAKKAGSYIVEMKHVETVELASALQDESEAPQAGDKSTLFIHTKTKDGEPNQIGQGQLKAILGPLGAMLDTKNIGEILEGCKGGIRCAVVVKVRPGKDGYEDSQDLIKLEVI